MARKTSRNKTSRKTAARKAAPHKPPRRKARKAAVKGPGTRAAADKKAAAGAVQQWTSAEVEEAFRRFAEANPHPQGELKSINPFTLLVAVVLSAQATDAGVNKATPALFAAADTPAKMAALGEARVQDFIKTIGLFRTKAKNVVALSKQLIEQYDGEVPRTREALEAVSYTHLDVYKRQRISCASATGWGWHPARRRSRSNRSCCGSSRTNICATPIIG